MRFNVATIGAAALMGVGMAGCGSSDNATATTTTDSTASTGSTAPANTSAKGSSFTIAVIPKGATHEYWNAIHAGANAAGKELGVTISWSAPEKEDDQEGQIKLVDDAIQQQVSAICLAPLSDTALRNPVEQAMKANIPVVIMDSGLKDTKFSSYVATDNEKGGEIAGEYLAKILNGKGNVIMIRYEVGSASTDLREKGFLTAIAKYPGIKIVSDNQYAGVTAESAMKSGENVLSAHKKSDGSLDIDGLYTPNESSTFGLLRVLQDNKWAGKIKFVGFDSSAKLDEGLASGQINGLVVQDPYKMGHDAVTVAVNILNKKDYPKNEDTGATLATTENMKQPNIDKLLHPPSP